MATASPCSGPASSSRTVIRPRIPNVINKSSDLIVPISLWNDLIDPAVPADRSLLLRYWRVFSTLKLLIPVDRNYLSACSIREGARMAPVTEHRGVRIYVCDETTAMSTGTYKDLDACLTVSIARTNQVHQLVLSSGGNLGYALAKYATRAGLEIFVFQPATTLYKLDAATYSNPGIRLISVDLPEPDVKRMAQAFAQRYGILQVPDARWRFASSATRAMFLLEHALSIKDGVDYLAQTVCAGFGPVGIYKCFSSLAAESLISEVKIPSFLGFQQEANAPMVRAWRDGCREIGTRHIGASPEHYLEPGLYNTNPAHNYTRLFSLMTYFGGDLSALSQADYEAYAPQVLSLLQRVGIELTRRGSGDLLEKTGVLTGVGLLKAIDTGGIQPGQGVIYMLTGGRRESANHTEQIQPFVHVDSRLGIDDWVERIGQQCYLKAPSFHSAADRLLWHEDHR